MSPFWHPLSTLLLTSPPCLATPVLLRVVLGADGTAKLRYAGDRMWPAVTHGENVTVAPPDDDTLRPGTVVVVCPDGIPDLLRVDSVEGEELRLAADADPETRGTALREEVLGVARLPDRRANRFHARARRLLLDAREAWTGGPDAGDDPAQTVREKYDSQADAYADSGPLELEPGLDQAIRGSVSEGARMLVVGSGSGRECFALARAGFDVTGLDFAPAMIARSEAEARRRELDVTFRLGDLRGEEFGAPPYDAILFTYDVYSFLPGRDARIEALGRMRSILTTSGRLFLSARRIQSAYDRIVLTLQWIAGRGRGEWGDSHTRWVDGAGRLHRSYVHVFSPRALADEIDRGGFEMQRWRRGHGTLLPRLL